MTDIPPDALQLEFERVWCPRHGEPLRATWPAGHGAACVHMFQALAAQGDVWEEAKRLGAGENPTPRDLERVLDIAPMCCRMPAGELLRVYVQAGFGVRRHCDGCGAHRWGAPYATRARVFKHLCFHCVIHRTRASGGK